MDMTVASAGVLCLLLGTGHATLGLKWILPGIDEESLGTSPFGGRTLSAATIHATWHIVTVFAFAAGVVLLFLASGADPATVVLRVFAAMWLGIATVAVWAGARRVKRVRDLLRLPVPALFVVVAVLCWMASL